MRVEPRRTARSPSRARRDPSRRGTHSSVRFSSGDRPPAEGNRGQPQSHMHGPAASPTPSPAAGFTPVSVSAQAPWVHPTVHPTPPWIPQVQSPLSLPAPFARMTHPAQPAPVPYMPQMVYPGMPPYAYHANWSYPELYRDMATAAGLGMGTPYRNPFTGPRTTEAYHFAPYAPPVPGSAIGGILDAMLTPPSDPRGFQRDIEQTLPGGHVTGNATEWKPTWAVFHLKAFRGLQCQVIEVHCGWDDEQLLKALKEAYKALCGWHRGCLSPKELRYVSYQRYAFID